MAKERAKELVEELNALMAREYINVFKCQICRKLRVGHSNKVEYRVDCYCKGCDECTAVCFECYLSGGDYYYPINDTHMHDHCNIQGSIDSDKLVKILHSQELFDKDVYDTILSAGDEHFVVIKCERGEKIYPEEKGILCVILSIGDDFMYMSAYLVDEDIADDLLTEYNLPFNNIEYQDGALILVRNNIRVTITDEKIICPDASDEFGTCEFTPVGVYIIDKDFE